MTLALNCELYGFPFEAMSHGSYNKEPCIAIPVSVIEALESDEIGSYIKELVEQAYFARALDTAYWINTNCRGGELIPGDVLDRNGEAIAQMEQFAGQEASIDEALVMIEASHIARDRQIAHRERRMPQRRLGGSYAKTFLKLGRRDGFRCKQCSAESNSLQIDHVMPLSKGGTNDLDNLQLLCPACNHRKGDSTPET